MNLANQVFMDTLQECRFGPVCPYFIRGGHCFKKKVNVWTLQTCREPDRGLLKVIKF